MFVFTRSMRKILYFLGFIFLLSVLYNIFYIDEIELRRQSAKKTKDLNRIVNKVFEEKVDERISINTASKSELIQLPGIGEKTADKILSYRKNTPFLKLKDILKIKGIGEKKFAKIEPFITL